MALLVTLLALPAQLLTALAFRVPELLALLFELLASGLLLALLSERALSTASLLAFLVELVALLVPGLLPELLALL